MKGMGGGMQAMLKQANQMQRKMEKLKEELAEREYTATAGGDGIKVFVTGDQRITKIDIHPDLQSDGDLEMISDLIMAASNEAIKTAKEDSEKEMSKITGGLGGLFGGMM